MKIILSHWMEGGTGMTNFGKEDLEKYETALDLSGDTRIVLCSRPIYVSDDPDSIQYLNRTCHSLHVIGEDRNISDFWELFRSLYPVTMP